MEEQPKVQYYNTAGTATLQPIIKTIKIDVRVWDSLKSLKKENETFNDVIKELLQQRTKALGNDNIKAIKYKREIIFFTTVIFGQEVGVEAEYNEVKGHKNDFVLDLKIKKIFYGKRQFNPSEFFGVDNAHKHYSELYLDVYLIAVSLVIKREFRIGSLTGYAVVRDDIYYEGDDIYYYKSLTRWKHLYSQYGLSQESFNYDIEDPLRLSDEDKPTKDWEIKINESTANKVMREYKK